MTPLRNAFARICSRLSPVAAVSVPEPSRNERCALFVMVGLTAAVFFGLAILPKGILVDLASRLSKDGQLAPASFRIIRALSLISYPIAAVLILLLCFRRWESRVLRRVLEALSQPSTEVFLPLLVGGAVLIRLVWIVAVPSLPVTDFRQYHELALRLLETGQYVGPDGNPTAFRPPGYPFMLVLLYRVFGTGLWAPKILNAALGSGTVLLVYLLARRSAGEACARLAAALVAIFPSQVGYSSLLCTEVPFTFLMLMFLWTAEKLEERRRRRLWIPAASLGLLFGIASLMRPQHSLLPVMTFFLQALRSGWRRAFAVHAPLVVAMGLLVSLWGLRNIKAVGGFVPFSTNAGANFYYGNNPWTNGTGFEIGDQVPDETLAAGSELERNRLGFHLGFRFLREYPLRVPVLAFRKIVMMLISDGAWTHWTFGETARPLPASARSLMVIVANAFYWPILILFGFEILVFRWRRTARTAANPYLDLCLFYTLLTTMLWLGQERYHFPLVPILCVGAATLLARLAAGSGQNVRCLENSNSEMKMEKAC